VTCGSAVLTVAIVVVAMAGVVFVLVCARVSMPCNTTPSHTSLLSLYAQTRLLQVACVHTGAIGG
jgi:hypothetical protein